VAFEVPQQPIPRSLNTRNFTTALHRRDSRSPLGLSTGIFIAAAKMRVLY
jgi:hypothetical protein